MPRPTRRPGLAILAAAVLSLAALGGTGIQSPALAEDRAAMLDAIVLNLSAEGWAETDRATVHASIEAAFTAEQGQDMRATVLQALDRLAPEAEWKLTRFGQVRDAAGLDRWQVGAEVRLRQDALEGLRDRAEEISRPGMRVSVDAIDFSPVLADRERLRTELRERIYQDAAAELRRLRETFPEQNFTMGQINFAPDMVAPVAMLEKAAPVGRMMAMAADSAGGAISVSDRITVSALVLIRTAPPAAE